MKNIYKSKINGSQFYSVYISVSGKRVRKYFKTADQAREYLQALKDKTKNAVGFIESLKPEQLLDIESAIKMLPKDKTLLEIVQKFVKASNPTISMKEAFCKYLAHREKVGKSTKLRIRKFFDKFPEWADATPPAVSEWLLLRGAPKTIKEWRYELSQFYEFCKRREITKTSPFDMLTQADFPKILRKAPDVFKIPDAALFMEFLEEYRPQHCAWFAIACFAGIRRAEINRLKPNMFDFENKRITLPFNIVKTGETWEMSELPANLWVWLEKYGTPKIIPDTTLQRLQEKFVQWISEKKGVEYKWKRNMCRHSFCTYHLSVYRDPARTSLLLKHRNPATMWQHYLAGLINKEKAKTYFKILPIKK